VKGEPGATFAFHEYPRSDTPTNGITIETR
jgi:hypothetical protein